MAHLHYQMSRMKDDQILKALRVNELKGVLRALGTSTTGNRSLLVQRIKAYLDSADQHTHRITRSNLEHFYHQLLDERDTNNASARASATTSSPSRPATVSSSPQSTAHSHPPAPKPQMKHTPFLESVISVIPPQLMTTGAMHRVGPAGRPAYYFHAELSPQQVMLLQSVTPTNKPFRLFLRVGHKRKGDAYYSDEFPRNGSWQINDRTPVDRLSLRGRPLDITPYVHINNPPMATRIKIEGIRTTDQVQNFDVALVEVVIANEVSPTELFHGLLHLEAEAGRAWAQQKLASPESEGGDEDLIVNTTESISLKCPLSHKRISTPARGEYCNHLQCFDALTYIQMNALQCRWNCPICHRPILIQGLRICDWMTGVLELAPSDCEHALVHPDLRVEYAPSSMPTSPSSDAGPHALSSMKQEAKDEYPVDLSPEDLSELVRMLEEDDRLSQSQSADAPDVAAASITVSAPPAKRAHTEPSALPSAAGPARGSRHDPILLD
ncbi:uncharacterized protein MONBRDRAFT_31004 [Monosiga brevicollis MX1]|uniref:Uncharacterized protein n=1 Tax=Monosiga brevicollis TaxID=81824 RepID=A9UQP6_MONBE|nr:uncharacterized protein MONBRDRAFT_31004 [Monosiga brevicollis MX1]EDQ93081.1 predicted protein [Monosiga brevicollis MX1]|eukprot:XP_001742843.1 hypothetical protein [Monosiga brevicollis MX1]